MVMLLPVAAWARAAALSIAPAACGSSKKTSASAGGSVPAGVQSPTEQSLSGGKKGGTLTALQTEDFEHLDPGQSYFQIDYGITSATQRSLYAYKPNTFSEVTPDLAEGPPQFSDGNKLRSEEHTSEL